MLIVDVFVANLWMLFLYLGLASVTKLTDGSRQTHPQSTSFRTRWNNC